MNKKNLLCIYISILIIISTLPLMKISEEVKGIENNPNLSNPLDLNYIWEKTGDLCNVIYEYPDYLIPKGRAFGSWGGHTRSRSTAAGC